jgi:hypothetical protein
VNGQSWRRSRLTPRLTSRRRSSSGEKVPASRTLFPQGGSRKLAIGPMRCRPCGVSSARWRTYLIADYEPVRRRNCLGSTFQRPSRVPKGKGTGVFVSGGRHDSLTLESGFPHCCGISDRIPKPCRAGSQPRIEASCSGSTRTAPGPDLVGSDSWPLAYWPGGSNQAAVRVMRCASTEL